MSGYGGLAAAAVVAGYVALKGARLAPAYSPETAPQPPQEQAVDTSAFDPVCLNLAKQVYNSAPQYKTAESWERLLDLAWAKDLTTLTGLLMPIDVPGPAYSSDELAVLEVFRRLNKTVSIVGSQVGPTYKEILLKPTGRTTCKAVTSVSADLQVALQSPSLPIIQTSASGLAVQVPRKDRQYPKLSDYSIPDHAGLWFPVGVDINNQVHGVNLMDSNSPHLLIGGTTGSGKSVLALHALTHLTQRYTPDQLNLAVVDPGMVDLVSLNDCRHLWNGIKIQSSPTDVIELFEAVVSEMHDRQSQMLDLGINCVTTQFPQLILWAEEFSHLGRDKDMKQVLEASVIALAELGRKCGIHLILSTQRPDKDVCTPLIRSNLPSRIALKVAQRDDSPIILGGDRDFRAVGLLGKGDLILKTNSPTGLRLQGFAP